MADHSPDLWASPFRRRWDSLTLAGGTQNVYLAGENHQPSVGWVWTWRITSGSAEGKLRARLPGAATMGGLVADGFTMPSAGSVLVPYPVTEFTVKAGSGSSCTVNLGAYPVSTSHAASVFPTYVELVTTKEIGASGGGSDTETVNVPDSADLYMIEGQAGLSDGCEVSVSDANGNTPSKVIFDKGAHVYGVGTPTPWRPVYPGGTVQVKNLANAAAYYTIRLRFDTGTFGAP